jgi:RNA polymerase sigma-70 factor (ECF subfamily)
MTGQAGQFSRTFGGSRTELRAPRSHLTCREASSRRGAITFKCLTTGRNLEAAVHEGRESFSQADGPLEVALMKRISMGDTLAFAEFYDRYSALLFSIAAKVVGDLQEAEEILQDSARLVWERAPLYDPRLGKPLSWAVVITRNKAIDRLRKLQRESLAIAKITEQAVADFLTGGRKAPSGGISNENCVLLRGALRSLPAEQRVAIELAFFTGLSQTQIAAQLAQPLGTIKARIRRGMLAMREALEEQL